MPSESRWFVKVGLLYLLVTFVAGSVLLTGEALGHRAPYIFGVEHAHLGTVGWLVNIVIGIALWLLPLNRQRFPSTQGRYPPGAVLACFALLNGGLLTRVVAEPWYVLAGQPFAAAMLLLVASLAQTIAIVLFVAIAWQRVRAPSQTAPGIR